MEEMDVARDEGVPFGTVLKIEDGVKVGLMLRTRRSGLGWCVGFFKLSQVLGGETVLTDVTYSVPGTTPMALLTLTNWYPGPVALTVRRSDDTTNARRRDGRFVDSLDAAMAACRVGDLLLIGPEGKHPTGALLRVNEGWLSTFHRPRYMSDWEVDGLFNWYDVTTLHSPE